MDTEQYDFELGQWVPPALVLNEEPPGRPSSVPGECSCDDDGYLPLFLRKQAE